MRYDVVIVGGGIAGLSAALLLGRCRRSALVCCGGPPRNAPSRALHGFLSRDGVAPLDLLRAGREQLARYGTVEHREALVRDASRCHGGFAVKFDGGGRASARKLLLATGVTDDLPEVSGLRERFGVSVFHCPYCDGWEVRDQPLAAYGTGREGADLALELTGWSRDVVLCTGGPPRLSDAQRRRLARRGVAVREDPVDGLEGRGGRLERVRFKAGDPLPRRALFLTPRWKQRSDLAARLGCRIDESGLVEVESDGATSVPGVYAAGDTAGGLRFAVGAASAGAEAAVGINAALLREELAPKWAKAAR